MESERRYGYESFDFMLEWNDLPDDFREEKIDAIMEKRGCTGKEIGNPAMRLDVDIWISSHFPLYF